jgi:hypothetical protein
MEGPTNLSEGVNHAMDGRALTSGGWCLSREARERGEMARSQKPHVGNFASSGSSTSGVFTAAAGTCGPPSAAESPLFLSEALTDSHWGNEALTSRGQPISDWATFSPVNSSSNHHSRDTLNWVQITSGDEPTITGNKTTSESTSNVPTVDSRSHQDTDSTSPGWQAFSLGGDIASAFISWSETTPSGATGSSNTVGTTDRTRHPTSDGCCSSDEPREVERAESCATATCRSRHQSHHSCVTVFRECFASGQGPGDSRGREEREMATHPVAIEYEGDWRCLKDDSFAKLLWAWSQTSLHHSPPSSCQARLSSLLWGDSAGTEVVPNFLCLCIVWLTAQ